MQVPIQFLQQKTKSVANMISHIVGYLSKIGGKGKFSA